MPDDDERDQRTFAQCSWQGSVCFFIRSSAAGTPSIPENIKISLFEAKLVRMRNYTCTLVLHRTIASVGRNFQINIDGGASASRDSSHPLFLFWVRKARRLPACLRESRMHGWIVWLHTVLFLIGGSKKKLILAHVYINFGTTFKLQDHILSGTEVVYRPCLDTLAQLEVRVSF